MEHNLKTIIITGGGIIGVASSVFLLTFIVLAWTGPLSTPPTCPEGEVGCDVPLHTGVTAQSKTGGLEILAFLASLAKPFGQLGTSIS